MKKFAWVLLSLFAFAAAGLTATHPMPVDYNIPDAQSYNAHFGNMDPNKDGKVSWPEFKAYFPKADEKVFASIDLNKDGTIDHDEWHKFKEAHDLKHKD